MKLLYDLEHLKCKNYDLNNIPIIENVHIKKGEVKEIEFPNSEIIFLLDGRFTFSYEMNYNSVIEKKHILFLPPGSRILVSANDDCQILTCRIEDTIKLCDAYTPEHLFFEEFEPTVGLHPLPFNERVEAFLDSLLPCMDDGLRCSLFFNLKIKEFFFLLRAYYTKKELFNFFHPVLSGDIKFSQFIWNNYRKVSTVSDFAQLYNYSTSRFKGKFKEIFGIPALQWLNSQRAKNIYYDLRFTDKSFIEISEEYHFTSTSYLSTFCKKNFSSTPKEVRKLSSTVDYPVNDDPNS